MASPASAPARDLLTRVDGTSNARDVALQADPHETNGAEANEIYDVVSVLYHALKGVTAYDKYISDAQKAGDQELERFFRACRTEEHARARRARALLVARMGDDDSDGATSASDENIDGISDGG